MISKFTYLKCVLLLAIFDALSLWLLIFFYITTVDLVWLVNVVFVLTTFVLLTSASMNFRFDSYSMLFFIFFVVGLGKAAFYSSTVLETRVSFLVTYNYSLIMPLLALLFAAQFNASDHYNVMAFLQRFANSYTAIAFFGILVYSGLYLSGIISYFGIGTNLHYAYPFLLTKARIGAPLLFLAFILLSGKRAVLVNFLVQSLAYFGSDLRTRPMFTILSLSLIIIFMTVIALYTDLLDRFSILFSGDFSITDPYMTLVAFSGRFEEVTGVIQYFSDNPQHLLLGAPPGAFYIWNIEISGYSLEQNYAHLAPVGYLFRYGAVFTLILYASFARLLIYHWDPRNPLYLVFVGIMSSSLFGANLFSDPIGWLFIGLLINLSSSRRPPPVTEQPRKVSTNNCL